MKPSDTSEAAWAVVEEGIRGMSPADRIRRAASLTAFAHRVALAQIRQMHPDETDRQHRLRLAARIIDPETMRLAFGYVDDRP